MKLSKSPFKTSKTRGTDEFKSVEIMFQTGQLKRHAAGVYGFGPLILRALNKTMDLMRHFLNKYDCVEVSVPLLQAKSLWLESGRWEDYKKTDTTFYCKGRDSEYFFSPTAEEFVSDLVKSHINSYRDLNFNIYQIGHKFRDEIRVRGGLTRGKEFIMKDGYSFNDTQESLLMEYEKMKRCYIEMFNAMGLDAKAVQAVNNFGGKVSEEIVVFSNMGADIVLYDEKTGLAFNKEVLDDENTKSIVIEKYGKIDEKKMIEKTAIELGHIFQLDQVYSKTMNLHFTNEQGKKDYCWMGCYGIGIGRALNIVLEQNCDKDGLVFPISIAPYKIGIVCLCEAEQIKKANELYNYFESKQIDILYDDRDLSLGVKIKDMLLHGIPYMVVIGKNISGELLEVENRKTREKTFITKEQLLELIS